MAILTPSPWKDKSRPPTWDKSFPKRSPIAERYPLMSWAELEEMASFIKKTDTLPLVYKNQAEELLDGSNSYFAIRLAGKEPKFRVVPGDQTAQEMFVYRRNVLRRNLSALDRAKMAIQHLEALGWDLPENPPQDEGTTDAVVG